MYYQKEELFWRERQEKLRVLSGVNASPSYHSMVPATIAHPAYSPSLLQPQHFDKGSKVHEGQHAADRDLVLKAVPAAQLCLGSSNRQQLQLQKHVLALAELREDLADRVRAAEAGKLAAAERKLAEQRRLERQLETRLRRACSGIEDQEARVQALMQEVDSELHAYSGIMHGGGHQPEEQDVARMAAQVDRLRRKKAALSLVAYSAPPVPMSALISKAKCLGSSPGHDRAGKSNHTTENLQTNPAHFSALRQAMNMSPSMDGRAGRATISDWEHEPPLEAADIDLEGLPSDEALQNILGQMEQRHKLSMAQVQQACAAQLTALQDEYSAALEERERGYSELLEELRSLRRRCPSPIGGRTAARAIFGQKESQQVYLSTGLSPPREARLNRQGRPAAAAPAATRPHLGSCREASAQLSSSCSPPEHGLTRRPAAHNALQHGNDGDRAYERQQSDMQQQNVGDSGRQLGHLKPSRIPSLRPRLAQPCSPQEVLDSPGCPSAAKPDVPPQQEHTPAQHRLPAQQHITPGPRSRSPAELLWPTPPSSSRDSLPGTSSRNKQVLAMGERDAAQAHSASAVHHGLKHISHADLDLIMGASEQASEGVAALLQGLELPL